MTKNVNMTLNLDKEKENENKIMKEFKEFISQYHDPNSSILTYKKLVLDSFQRGKRHLNLEIEQLASFNSFLYESVCKDPGRVVPLMEETLRRIVKEESKVEEKKIDEKRLEMLKKQNKDIDDLTRSETDDRWQVLLSWKGCKPNTLRELDSSGVSNLVCVKGIVTKSSTVFERPTQGNLCCNNPKCRKKTKIQIVTNPFTTTFLSGKCKENGCGGTIYFDIDSCNHFIDEQTIRLQELQEDVPTGEIPRSIMCVCQQKLVDKAAPGTRVKIVGVLSTKKNSEKSGKTGLIIQNSFIIVLGMELISLNDRFALRIFSDDEEESFKQFSRKKDVYEILAYNIDKKIFGHKDIKKAIVCLLFGGTMRIYKDGNKRRGDINVLLLGDPSTAKSQLLKFTEKIAPIGIYTSGKGSSAAGLTASVVRDSNSSGFYLEGGSMVLADGGVCCIDEFDKMNEQDRVAIHEAMEQQTISIAKAGITTVLNTRTSVLAAANPVGGRYEDFKSPEDQIEFQSTILSRFDMIFILRDTIELANDKRMAKHVTNLHSNIEDKNMVDENDDSEVSLDFLTNYISYCKSNCFPRLNQAAQKFLVDFYVEERRKARNHDKNIFPITVRQLEALMRITESLAKLQLLETATIDHAKEAVRLFKCSTLKAISSSEFGKDFVNSKENDEIETQIRMRVGLQNNANVEWICQTLEKSKGVNRKKTEKVIYFLVKKGEFKYINNRKSVQRIK